jgi:hypothetical protein
MPWCFGSTANNPVGRQPRGITPLPPVQPRSRHHHRPRPVTHPPHLCPPRPRSSRHQAPHRGRRRSSPCSARTRTQPCDAVTAPDGTVNKQLDTSIATHARGSCTSCCASSASLADDQPSRAALPAFAFLVDRPLCASFDTFAPVVHNLLAAGCPVSRVTRLRQDSVSAVHPDNGCSAP